MATRNWLAIAAVLYAIFGIGMLLVPGPFLSVFGFQLGAGGEVIARILGSALATLALAFWLYRDKAKAARPLMMASLIYNVIDFFVVVAATTAGTMNAMGWSAVALHIVLAAGFAYCLFGVADTKARQPLSNHKRRT